jgi:hypothetical protein
MAIYTVSRDTQRWTDHSLLCFLLEGFGLELGLGICT